MRAVSFASRPRSRSQLATAAAQLYGLQGVVAPRGIALTARFCAVPATSSTTATPSTAPPVAATAAAAALAGSAGGKREISASRLQQFMQAEIAVFAELDAQSISLSEVLKAASPAKVARLSYTELPTRFAHRIYQIEELPGWTSSPELKEVHQFYLESFKDLRLVELEDNNLAPFTHVMSEVKSRMHGVIPRLAASMRVLREQQHFSEAMVNEWLDTFLLSRIGTEMLSSQYAACVEPVRGFGGKVRKGIVDDACDPVEICTQAAKYAQQLCRQHFKIKSDVLILVESSNDDGMGKRKIRFPYVPQYLFYVMVELLKNSARATVDKCSKDPKKFKDRPIVITVTADPSQIAIRVDDLAGGIPFAVADRVWSYMYTTASETQGAVGFSEQGTPLAGYGVGLPLSRLYARYLGGSLHLTTMPGIGTSAYLYLKRLESEAREELPARRSVDDPFAM